MTNRTYFTIGQAAKETGKAKSTIKKAIDNGELSVAEKTARGFKIDAAELFRVFPKRSEQLENAFRKQNETASGTEKSFENTALHVEVKMLREQIEALNSERDRERRQLSDQIEDLRDRLTHSQGENAKLLQDQRSQPQQGRGFTLWPFGRKQAAS